MEQHNPSDVHTLIILGASGDLTSRLLLPGLGSLLATQPHRRLHVVGVGQENLPAEAWQRLVRVAVVSGGAPEDLVDEVVAGSSYVALDVTDESDLRRLVDLTPPHSTWYFALPPEVTIEACRHLDEIDLPADLGLAFEKPFGTDERSARDLNTHLHRVVAEERVFRIDHFLGEAMVLNILGFRFANRLFEPVWNAVAVDRVEIVADETLALEGRAGYYDGSGALVDMLQNHLMAIFALVAMEEPARVDATELHDLMVHVLRATRVREGGALRGRYTAGTAGDTEVPAYVDEEGVDPSRGTETYAELTLEVANTRWAGVPFILRSGKALAEDRREVVVHLRPVAHSIAGLRDEATPNVITLGIKPGAVTVDITTNGGGDTFALEPTRLRATMRDGAMNAYGEVLRAVLDLDHILSVRADFVEEAWRIVDPVRNAWTAGEAPLVEYAAGSNGPSHS